MFRRNNTLIMLIVAMTFMFMPGGYAQNPDFRGAAGDSVDGQYTITIRKIEISQDGTSWITLAESDQSFNIASVAIGQSMGSYLNVSNVSVGTYTRLRVTLSRTMTIKGRTLNPQAGNYYYTTTQNGQTAGFNNAGVSAVLPLPANYEAVTFQVPADAQESQADVSMQISGDNMIMTENISDDPIVISEGQVQDMFVSFNTDNMVGFEQAGPNYIFYPLPPEENFADE